MELVDHLALIEDRLFIELGFDVYERAVYYQLLRRTLIAGREIVNVPLGVLGPSAGMKATKVRDVVRSLAAKGAIHAERTRTGYTLRLIGLEELLPAISTEHARRIDIEQLDFYVGRRYVPELLRREGERCFYCLRDISASDLNLDHVVPRSVRVDNSYRNIVAACFTCNTDKGDSDADDYLRKLFRSGRLSESELEERLELCVALAEGRLPPELVTNR